MALQPLPYHVKVCNHFRQQTKTWDFFAAAKTKEDQLQEFKTGLLKNTYKFDPAADAFIYDKVNLAREKLDLQQLPVTVYQAQYTDELNASIVYLSHEAHIVFSGKITQLLNDDELLAVIAHELAHVKLYVVQNGDLEISNRIINAIANNYQSEASYYKTARLFRLYTEIFCDRGAYQVLGDPAPVITSLVKTATGLDRVNADSYIKQAEEIFSADIDTRASTLSHPENFIRARAIQLWHQQQEDAEATIIKMIEGSSDLDQLDIFKQKDLGVLTRQLMQLYLKPKWFRSVTVTGLAKQYFPDFTWDEQAVINTTLVDRIAVAHKSVKDYLGYVLLDFALADSTLDEIPAGWAFQFAEDMQLKDAYDAIIRKELKFSDKKLQQHRQKMLAAFHEVKEGEGEQIYDG